MKNAKIQQNISIKNAKIFLTNQSKCFRIQLMEVLMERKIYKELLNWKKNNLEMPLMVIRSKTSR